MNLRINTHYVSFRRFSFDLTFTMSCLISFLLSAQFAQATQGVSVIQATQPPIKCEFIFNNFRLDERRHAQRLDSLTRVPTILQSVLYKELVRSGRIVYEGAHQYEPGTDFLASNESDWRSTPMDKEPTDLLIGFASNSVWDLAMRKNAKKIIIADWSLQPIIAQAFVVEPLIRIARTPQEFLLLATGIAPTFAQGLTMAEAFEMANNYHYNKLPMARHKYTLELMKNLAEDSRISETEFNVLSSYFAIPFNMGTTFLGPFQNLRNQTFALLSLYWGDRYYNSSEGLAPDSVFSSQENFDYLKRSFAEGRIKYALTDVTDHNFYSTVKKNAEYQGSKNVTLSISNIFDCCGRSGPSFHSLQDTIAHAYNTFSHNNHSALTVFRTTQGSLPHYFFRYEIRGLADIGLLQETKLRNELTDIPDFIDAITQMFGGRGRVIRIF